MEEGIVVNKHELVVEIAKRSGLAQTVVADVLNTAMDVAADAVQRREDISISGFGTLTVKMRKAHMARNPKTNELIEVQESFHPAFKPGSKLKAAANLEVED